MKILFLGTGSIAAKALYSSYLIDNHILVDCGSGIIKQMLNHDINVYDIDRLFISHIHGDHILDIPFLILMRSFNNLDNTLTIYGPKKLKEVVKNIIKEVYEDIGDSWYEYEEKAHIKYAVYEESGCYEFDKYNIEYLPVKHGNNKDCYGFIISDSINKISITGDSQYCPSIIKMIENTSHIIIDTTFLQENHSHMGIDTIVKLSNEYPDTIFIPSHLNDDVRQSAKQLNISNIQVYDDLHVLFL